MKRFTPDQAYVADYSTVKRLDQAILAAGLQDIPHTLYRFEDGRVTAIFHGAAGEDLPMIVAMSGFAVVG